MVERCAFTRVRESLASAEVGASAKGRGERLELKNPGDEGDLASHLGRSRSPRRVSAEPVARLPAPLRSAPYSR